MNEKDYEKLVKEYEKLNASKADLYPLSFKEQTDRLLKAFDNEKFLAAPSEKQISVAINWLRDGDALMKYYQGFLNRDMEYLNDALFETAHLCQMSNILSPGCDHGFYGMRITPNLLAANMTDRLNFLLPAENGLSKGKFVGASVANILMAIIYDDADLKTNAIASAEKQLAKKNPLYCQLHIECMLAILNRDAESFNTKINDYCDAYTQAKDLGLNAFNKRFCVEAHGMYNLARSAFGGEMKNDIAMPIATNFCQDLANWQNDHNNEPGKVRHVYPDKLGFYNRLMKATPVQMHLISRGKEMCLDTSRYLADLIEANNLFI